MNMIRIAAILCLIAGTANAQYRGVMEMNMPPLIGSQQDNDMRRMQEEFDRKLEEQRRSLQLQMDNQPRFAPMPYSPPIMR